MKSQEEIKKEIADRLDVRQIVESKDESELLKAMRAIKNAEQQENPPINNEDIKLFINSKK